MVNPSDSRVPEVYAAALIPWIFALITLCLRFVSRSVVRTGYWYDDWFAIAAWIFSGVIAIGTLAATRHGLGQHVIVAGYSGVHLYLKLSFMSEFFYALAIGSAKLSVLLFYWRIFHQASRRMRLSIIALAAITIAWILATFIGDLASCHPLRAYWDWTDGHCVGLAASYIAFAIPNITTDALLMLLPVPEILKLQMPWFHKAGLIFTFALGGITIVISCARAKQASIISTTTDITWDLVDLGMYSDIEISLAAAAANLPSLGPLVKHIWRNSPFARSYLQRIYNPYPGHSAGDTAHGGGGSDGHMGGSRGANSDYGSDVELAKRTPVAAQHAKDFGSVTYTPVTTPKQAVTAGASPELRPAPLNVGGMRGRERSQGSPRPLHSNAIGSRSPGGPGRTPRDHGVSKPYQAQYHIEGSPSWRDKKLPRVPVESVYSLTEKR